MAIAQERRTTRLISVHDQPVPLRLSAGPSVTPGTYFIPGVNAAESEFEKCIFSFPNSAPIRYATLKELGGVKYVEVEVFPGKTPSYGTELDQKQDENGRHMEPQLRRALLDVTPEQIANELERQATFFLGKKEGTGTNMGVVALDHDPTQQDLNTAIKNNIDYMRMNVEVANKEVKIGRAPSDQALNHAAKLHKMGLLNPLPSWASINPDGGVAVDTMNCVNCGTVLRKSIIKCPTVGCGVIYDWKEAVERGIVAPRDVPKSKRVAAGLDDEEKVGKKEALQNVRDRVAQSFKERDNEQDSV